MSTVFTKIRLGEIPGQVIYADEKCFVILTIEPNNPGHLLVVPIKEISEWFDVPAPIWEHMARIAQKLGKIIKTVYNPPKVAFVVAGFDLPHAHIHVFSLFQSTDQDHDHIGSATQEELAMEADKIRPLLPQSGLV